MGLLSNCVYHFGASSINCIFENLNWVHDSIKPPVWFLPSCQSCSNTVWRWAAVFGLASARPLPTSQAEIQTTFVAPRRSNLPVWLNHSLVGDCGDRIHHQDITLPICYTPSKCTYVIRVLIPCPDFANRWMQFFRSFRRRGSVRCAGIRGNHTSRNESKKYCFGHARSSSHSSCFVREHIMHIMYAYRCSYDRMSLNEKSRTKNIIKRYFLLLSNVFSP